MHDFAVQEPTRTTSGTAVDSRPQWNIDARSIVFQRTTLTGSALHLLHLYGDLAGQTDMLELCNEGGKTVAFASAVSAESQIWVMRTDGSNRQQLTFGPMAACFRAWSPSSDEIVFVRGDPLAATPTGALWKLSLGPPRRRFASAAAGRTLERPVRVNGSSVT